MNKRKYFYGILITVVIFIAGVVVLFISPWNAYPRYPDPIPPGGELRPLWLHTVIEDSEFKPYYKNYEDYKEKCTRDRVHSLFLWDDETVSEKHMLKTPMPILTEQTLQDAEQPFTIYYYDARHNCLMFNERVQPVLTNPVSMRTIAASNSIRLYEEQFEALTREANEGEKFYLVWVGADLAAVNETRILWLYRMGPLTGGVFYAPQPRLLQYAKTLQGMLPKSGGYVDVMQR